MNRALVTTWFSRPEGIAFSTRAWANRPIRPDIHARFQAILKRALAKPVEPPPEVAPAPKLRHRVRTDEELIADVVEEAYL